MTVERHYRFYTMQGANYEGIEVERRGRDVVVRWIAAGTGSIRQPVVRSIANGVAVVGWDALQYAPAGVNPGPGLIIPDPGPITVRLADDDGTPQIVPLKTSK